MPIIIHEFTVEREVDGELVELILLAELEVEPFVPGLTFGPPENCYPDEGGYAEIYTIWNIANGQKTEWTGTLTPTEKSKVEEDAYNIFAERAAEDKYHILCEKDDPDYE